MPKELVQPPGRYPRPHRSTKLQPNSRRQVPSRTHQETKAKTTASIVASPPGSGPREAQARRRPSPPSKAYRPKAYRHRTTHGHCRSRSTCHREAQSTPRSNALIPKKLQASRTPCAPKTSTTNTKQRSSDERNKAPKEPARNRSRSPIDAISSSRFLWIRGTLGILRTNPNSRYPTGCQMLQQVPQRLGAAMDRHRLRHRFRGSIRTGQWIRIDHRSNRVLHLSQHKTPGKFELGQRIVHVESDPLKLELNSNPNAAEISRIAQAPGAFAII